MLTGIDIKQFLSEIVDTSWAGYYADYLATKSPEEIKENIIIYFLTDKYWIEKLFPEINVDELENGYSIELESKVFNKIKIYYSPYVPEISFIPGITDIRKKDTNTQYSAYIPYFKEIRRHILEKAIEKARDDIYNKVKEESMGSNYENRK